MRIAFFMGSIGNIFGGQLFAANPGEFARTPPVFASSSRRIFLANTGGVRAGMGYNGLKQVGVSGWVELSSIGEFIRRNPLQRMTNPYYILPYIAHVIHDNDYRV